MISSNSVSQGAPNDLLLERRPQLVADLATRQRGDRVLFVHPARPRWILLNESAAKTARRFDGQVTLEDLADQLVSETGAPLAVIQEDLSELVQSLYSRGFLENERDQMSFGRAFAVGEIFIRVTDACNLTCTQCYAGSSGLLKTKKNELTTEEIRTLLREVRATGARSVVFSGGEPLLRPDMLDIIEYAHNELGFQVKLNTNGTLLLAPGTVERLVPVLREIQVSFDGPTAETHDPVRGRGSFASSVRGVKKYIEAGGERSLILCMTLMQSNIDIALTLPDFARGLGVKKIRFLNVVRDGRAIETWDDTLCPTTEQLIAFYDEFFFGGLDLDGIEALSGLRGFHPHIPEDFRNECLLCPVGMSAGVGPKGDVYPCSMFERPGYNVGNVRGEGGFQAILDSGKLQDLREELGKRPEKIEKCGPCTWKGVCQSGCAGTVDMENGSTKHSDMYCDVRDHLFMRLIFQENGQEAPK